MSITTEISRIKRATDSIKSSVDNLGLTDNSGIVVTASQHIEKQAEAIANISKRTGVVASTTDYSANVSIPKGYHDGTTSVHVAVDVNHYIEGPDEPDSSIGVDGDIYLVVSTN